MNNNLSPLNTILNISKGGGLYKIVHTSSSLIRTVNNFFPIYENIKPTIKNVNTIRKAFKAANKNNNQNNNYNSNNSNKTNIDNNVSNNKPAKKESNDNSLSFFQ